MPVVHIKTMANGDDIVHALNTRIVAFVELNEIPPAYTLRIF
ncbi:MAG TPA: hypothetical protein P5509_07350 [Bacteroidales bacterium]|nr:hypothetical protein [Bacteroidales bacterium]